MEMNEHGQRWISEGFKHPLQWLGHIGTISRDLKNEMSQQIDVISNFLHELNTRH
jgi:hypothetical protein